MVSRYAILSPSTIIKLALPPRFVQTVLSAVPSTHCCGLLGRIHTDAALENDDLNFGVSLAPCANLLENFHAVGALRKFQVKT